MVSRRQIFKDGILATLLFRIRVAVFGQGIFLEAEDEVSGVLRGKLHDGGGAGSLFRGDDKSAVDDEVLVRNRRLTDFTFGYGCLEHWLNDVGVDSIGDLLWGRVSVDWQAHNPNGLGPSPLVAPVELVGEQTQFEL